MPARTAVMSVRTQAMPTSTLAIQARTLAMQARTLAIPARTFLQQLIVKDTQMLESSISMFAAILLLLLFQL